MFTIADIEAGYSDPEWLGFGYLGERRHHAPAVRERADAVLLRHVNAHRVTRRRFAAWLNSAAGRHYMDWSTMFRTEAEIEIETHIGGQRLLPSGAARTGRVPEHPIAPTTRDRVRDLVEALRLGEAFDLYREARGTGSEACGALCETIADAFTDAAEWAT